jgi:hypothetical protein
MQWVKADSLLVERLGYGWTKENPAPWEVGLVFAMGRIANGGRLSIRDLAAYMGWSKRRGWECLTEAKARHSDLYSERDTRRDTPPQQSRTLAPKSGADPGHLTGARGVRSDSDPSLESAVGVPSSRSRAHEAEHARTAEDDDRVTAQDAELFLAQLHARRRIG